MPKELIHFKIAERTAKKLTGTQYAAPLETCPHGLLLGSVFHDALFYTTKPANQPLEQLAHTLHGANGQDTFALLRLQAEHTAKTGSPLAIALLTGMISHVFADITMHPMVWSLSGNYYSDDPVEKSRARQRHRALESLMDMVVCPQTIGRARSSLRLMLRRAGTDLFTAMPLQSLGDLAELSAEQTQAGLTSAWRTFAIFQTLFPHKKLAWLLYASLPWLPNPAAEIATLFYAPQLLKQKERLTGDVCFPHPVTGENQTVTLNTLVETAANMASNFCRTIEPAIFDSAPLDIPPSGPSLDTGLPGIGTQAMTHYAYPAFPKLP